MTRRIVVALVVVQVAIGFLQHAAVFSELSRFPASVRAAAPWPPGSSALLAAAIVGVAFLFASRRAGEAWLGRAGRVGAAGLALLAALGLFHFGFGVVTGRLAAWTTAPFLAGAAGAALVLRRLSRRGAGPPPAVPAAAAPGGPSWWDAVTAVFLLTALAAMAFPAAFEDARVIWGCRAFALDASGSLAGLADCSHRNYPPLFSVLLWASVRDPLFQGRLLAWLSLALFALYFRSRLAEVSPRDAAPALLFLVSTVQVWQGAATLYANVPLMVFLSAGTLLALGRPGSGAPPASARVAGALCLSAAVLVRPDGFYYLAVVAAAVAAARVLWGQRFPVAAFAAPVLAATAWALRPAFLRPASGLAGAYAGSFLGNATGEWRSAGATAGEAVWKVTEVFLLSWQGQWLSHKGLGIAIYLLAGITVALARKGLLSRGGRAWLSPDTRVFGLVTAGGLLAVPACYAVMPYVSDVVGAVQPFDGDYLACYRNFVRVGLGRMTVHLYPLACLYAVGAIADLGRARAAS